MGREELSARLQQTDDDRLSINRQIAQLKAVYEQMDKVGTARTATRCSAPSVPLSSDRCPALVP